MFAPSEKRGYLAAHSFWHYVRITALLTLAALMALSLTAAQASVAGSPAISNFSPAGGSAGTVVQINGTGLSSATAVTIGGVPAYFTIQSDSEIDATVPNGAGAGPVTVLTPSGSISSATGFNMTPAPMITSFTPTSGLPGTVVSLTGTGFSTVTSAAVNGVNASFQIHTDSSMNVTVPNSATTGPISVTNPGGTATSATNFTVLPVPAPTISSFSPTSGSVGTDVTIQGTGFATTTSVQFNGTSTTNFLAHNNDVMDVIVPVGASTGPITVINPAGSGTSASDFVVPSAPSITGFSPTSGLPGTLVHVTGTGFTGT
ncbi:MAG TPA: IPT/TIG domain-containing protein, partial [Armatimonadota bacterium]|nr:IPT/TIG domain-containing protein [Armatimonadota bacterium]